jgi:uncharacterized SAM-binding protein YcdF (DUF218 family)
MDTRGMKSSLWETLTKTKDEHSSRGTGDMESASSSRGGEQGERAAGTDSKPIEPEGSKLSTVARLKWFFFAFALVYVLVSAYHAPILTRMGRYLVVEHPPVKSDLIVCLAGGNVERGLTAADVYQRGLGSKVFVAREIIPDGYEILRRRGVSYPESRDQLIFLLKGLGVPESAILTSDTPSESTVMEAELVEKLVKENHYRSVLLITSPTHSRRAWLTFRKAIPDKEIRITVIPTPYSKFRAEDWWKTRRYVREVILEYQKLIYYKAKGPL